MPSTPSQIAIKRSQYLASKMKEDQQKAVKVPIEELVARAIRLIEYCMMSQGLIKGMFIYAPREEEKILFDRIKPLFEDCKWEVTLHKGWFGGIAWIFRSKEENNG